MANIVEQAERVAHPQYEVTVAPGTYLENRAQAAQRIAEILRLNASEKAITVFSAKNAYDSMTVKEKPYFPIDLLTRGLGRIASSLYNDLQKEGRADVAHKIFHPHPIQLPRKS